MLRMKQATSAAADTESQMTEQIDKQANRASGDASSTAERMEGGQASKAPSRIILGLIAFLLVGLALVLKLFGVI
ncbi:hypothetical protein DXT88_17005 [Herbaspirillum lusitanum]|nr:hypothetical protein [Herbaspirillum lusitanum]